MLKLISLKLVSAVSVLGLLVACATQPQQHVDYTAFKKAQPRSILVLPPANETEGVKSFV